MTVFQGQNLRAARAKAQLTQQELADRAGVQRRTVISAETGEHVPTAEAVARIARALDLPIDDLFEDEPAVAS